ncbi:uncharacterized protein Triagg1_539 [Trichoderma aggressivum f. europaeum]|uniref:DUF4246 domain-containing protein n=1 Tax=Trichoderma aggressivum f. europaeum TaxID=173218 RepID=A0AAE1JFV8_9HYPO|nr:hypothetical protein Triagg1_539 [Trichoderma aggressivum f. europaeum]
MNETSSDDDPGKILKWFPGTAEQEQRFRKWIEETDEPLLFQNVSRWLWENADTIFDDLYDEDGIQDILNNMAKDFQRWANVRDTLTTDKWKKEILGLDWSNYILHADFTPSMAEWCIEELRHKADLYQKTGLIPVLDHAACVIKSDKLVPEALNHELSIGSQKLLQVISNGEISHGGFAFDLIDPSICPLMYNRSRILPDRLIDLTDCLEACGGGDTLASLWDPNNDTSCEDFDTSFQWLPCNVIMDDAGHAKINSYINNLHPIEHADMYTTIEKFITLALPALDIVYRWPKEFSHQRIGVEDIRYDCKTPNICAGGCNWLNMPLSAMEAYLKRNKTHEEREALKKEQKPVAADTKSESVTLPECDENHLLNLRLERNEEYLDKFLRVWIFEGNEMCRNMLDRHSDPIFKWFNETHPFQFPELRSTSFDKHVRLKSSDVRSSAFFLRKNKHLQFIVKLSEIHLTPENPEYAGDLWGVDGWRNEHIVSTAFFCYDSDNVTDCHIYFDTAILSGDLYTVPHPESDDLLRAFNLPPAASSQVLGRVLASPGKAVFYPNVYRHRQGSFSLADRSRPGHYKVLKLCLVDPALPIISTSNVPPQQFHWWTECKVHREGVRLAQRLPPELRKIVYDYVDMPIDGKRAEDIRRQFASKRMVAGIRTPIGGTDEVSDLNGSNNQ